MNAAALIDTTLLDGNTAGATSVVGGGRLLTYGNNRIVGFCRLRLHGLSGAAIAVRNGAGEHAAGTDLDAIPRYHFRAKSDKILESA